MPLHCWSAVGSFFGGQEAPTDSRGSMELKQTEAKLPD
jgi:hypothetical protein